MAIKKIKAKWLDANGNFIRFVNLYFTIGSGVYLDNANVYDCPSLAAFNAAISTATAGTFPNGIEPKSTYGTNPAVDAHKFFIGSFLGLPLTNLYQGSRLVLNNGSYISFPTIVENISEGSGYTIPFIKYVTATGAEAYSFSWNQLYGGLDNTYHKDFFTVMFFPWISDNHAENEWHLNSFTVIGEYKSSLGAAVPTLRGGVGLINPYGSNATCKAFFEGIEYLDPDDPYPDVPDSGEEDPDPDGIPEPDDIPFPDDPDIDVTDIGFVTLYAPTKAQLIALSDFMWGDLFDISTLKKLFADPMDCILGLNLLPFHVNQGDIANVYFGNVPTNIGMYTAANQWVTINCGSINIGNVYDTYLDYAPYTKVCISLPFIGVQQLNTDDIAHKVINVKYKIDILSCACIAFISADDVVLYQFSGTCGYAVPVSASNYANLFKSAIDVGISTAMLAYTAGASTAAANTTRAAAAHEARMVAQTAEFTSSSASAVMNSKAIVKRSGSLGGGSGIMGIKKPYLIFEIPRLCKPARQAHFLGYPSFITIQVSGISGYAEFESIILSGVTCTEEERTMLADIFKGGVYV